MQEEERHNTTQDIKRYRAIFEKDPSSHVFAPLAEALRREGSLDEALTICVEGLQKHPNHISGKVVLGRIYYDKGMLNEAKKEFEEVNRIVPDNLLAERLLKDISEKMGEKGEVVKGVETSEGVPVTVTQSPVEKQEENKTTGIYTVTMAELLEKQGHYEEALKVYEDVFKRDSGNVLINERIERIRYLLRTKKPDNKDIKRDEERLAQIATWASKFKKG